VESSFYLFLILNIIQRKYIDNILFLMYIIFQKQNNIYMGGIVLEKVNVQLLLTQEEYESLKKNADKQGLTVPCYIKSVVLEDDYFYGFYKKLLDKVEQLPSGTKFNIKALFGVEWTMPKGIKLTLGRTYFNRVNKGIIDNVIATGKDSSNVMWYERK
jgi:hypothetical protein